MNQIRPVRPEKILSSFFLQIGQFPIIFRIAVYGMNDDLTVEYFRIGNVLTSYVSIIVQLIVAGICLGIFVSPYMPGGSKAVKAGAVYGMVMTVLYIMPPRIDNILAYLTVMSSSSGK